MGYMKSVKHWSGMTPWCLSVMLLSDVIITALRCVIGRLPIADASMLTVAVCDELQSKWELPR